MAATRGQAPGPYPVRASKVFHGHNGQLYQNYQEGMDQLGALGLVLNAVVLRNTFYIDQALDHLRVGGYPLLDEDLAHLSPFGCKHVNVIGTYSFAAPDLGPTGVRDPDAADE